MEDQQARERILRQSLETGVLMGVGFVPRAPRPAAPAADGPVVEVKPDATRRTVDAPPPGRAAATGTSKAAALDDVRRRHAEECTHCTSVSVTNLVFGEGNPDADLMFVGEAPGAEEDRTGRPFVGRAGQKLEEMIQAMGLRREDVYIANVLKARPPNNRTPLANEVAACAPWLDEQIRTIEPRVIVALGGPSSKFLLQTDTGITRIRGQWATINAGGFEVDVMPTFHPAYLLRNYTRETRERMWSDLQAVVARLGGRS